MVGKMVRWLVLQKIVVNLQPESLSEMKRKRGLIWLLASLCALVLTVLADFQGHETTCAQAKGQEPAPSVWEPQQEQSHEATLTDATLLYRICSTRPLRILPTAGSRVVRTITSVSGGAAKQYIVKPLHRFYDSRCLLVSSPLRLSASCDDYVIALRHIIR